MSEFSKTYTYEVIGKEHYAAGGEFLSHSMTERTTTHDRTRADGEFARMAKTFPLVTYNTYYTSIGGDMHETDTFTVRRES